MSVEVKKWAIRHKPTGFYLPPGRGWNFNGFTRVEPCCPEKIRLPRLFDTFVNARRSLTIWLKGVIEADRDEDTGWVPYVTNIKHRPNRKPEDMEIVEITITLP